MSEVELVLVNDTDKCTIYTIQFSEESETEYERFLSKFIWMSRKYSATPNDL